MLKSIATAILVTGILMVGATAAIWYTQKKPPVKPFVLPE